ncbi:TrmH family RNA methyltransferase [Alkalihalobacillus sp. NPDC078783]
MKQIDSSKNEQVKQWKKLHKKRGREKVNQFLIEGFHLVEEAVRAGIEFVAVIVSDEELIPSSWDVDDRNIILTNDSVLKELSETDSPQGIMAVCTIPVQQELSADYGRYLLIDRVQDPGNIGTLIRTADAVGMDGVIVEKGSVDLYNSKVLRSSQGSMFHLPVIKGELTDWIDAFKQAEVPVYGTSLHNALVYTEVQPTESFALILGNEGEGVQPDLLDRTDQNLYIPIYGKAESLNVAIAAGILLYHLRT